MVRKNRFLLDLLNGWWLRLNSPKSAVLVGSLDLKPSQGDKPSPHSSHVLMNVYRDEAKKHPVWLGYKVSTVANTNSMEPLLDANCVVVLELLSGEWSDRLIEQPFEKGDVVTYNTSVGSIIHVLKSRTTWLGEPAWILQGSNNFLPDMSKVLESGITGRLFKVCYCRQVIEGD